MFLASSVAANISALIWPGKFSLAVHLKVAPISFIAASVWPEVDSEPLDFILAEFSLVKLLLWPGELSLSMLKSILIVAYIASSIVPNLSSVSILDIIYPLSLQSSIVDIIDAFSLGLSLDKITLENIPILMNVAAKSIRFVFSESALVIRASLEDEKTLASSHSILVLANIQRESILFLLNYKTLKFKSIIFKLIFKGIRFSNAFDCLELNKVFL